MKCTDKEKCSLKSCQGRIRRELNAYLEGEIEKVLADHGLPKAATAKITRAITNELDASAICQIVDKQIFENQQPRNRYLDRVICHVFESFYTDVIARMKHSGRRFGRPTTFFNVVSRGEALDTFLRIVRDQCIGEVQALDLTTSIELIIKHHFNDEGHVDWKTVYGLSEFHTFAEQMTDVLFQNMLAGDRPVPAIENSMPARFNPRRINSMLKLMYRIWAEERRARQLEKLAAVATK